MTEKRADERISDTELVDKVVEAGNMTQALRSIEEAIEQAHFISADVGIKVLEQIDMSPHLLYPLYLKISDKLAQQCGPYPDTKQKSIKATYHTWLAHLYGVYLDKLDKIEGQDGK